MVWPKIQLPGWWQAGTIIEKKRFSYLISEGLIFILKGPNLVLELLDLNLQVLHDLGVLRDVVVDRHHILLQADLSSKRPFEVIGVQEGSILNEWH